MEKCKTCRYWNYQGFSLGTCSGIRVSSLIVPIPNQPKGKPNGKLLTKDGIVTDASFITTTQDWFCKNWERK